MTAEELFLKKYGNKITSIESWVIRFAEEYAKIKEKELPTWDDVEKAIELGYNFYKKIPNDIKELNIFKKEIVEQLKQAKK